MASLDFKKYTRCDDNLPCYGDLSDVEIFKELCNPPSDKSGVEVDEIQESLPTTKERLHAITILRKSFESNNQFLKELDAMELLVFNETKRLESKITDFLK